MAKRRCSIAPKRCIGRARDDRGAESRSGRDRGRGQLVVSLYAARPSRRQFAGVQAAISRPRSVAAGHNSRRDQIPPQRFARCAGAASGLRIDRPANNRYGQLPAIRSDQRPSDAYHELTKVRDCPARRWARCCRTASKSRALKIVVGLSPLAGEARRLHAPFRRYRRCPISAAILVDTTIEGVISPSRPAAYALALEVAKAGRHLYAEKPIAGTLKKASPSPTSRRDTTSP